MIPAPRAVLAAALAAALSGSLAACAQPQQNSRSRASASTLAACRQRADQVYNIQNRGDVYRADSYATNDRDSPFATSGLPGITSAGLGSRYQHAQFEDDCLSSSGIGAPGGGDTGIGSGATATPGPAGH